MNEMFRERPQAVADILRDLFGMDIPERITARIESNSFNDRPSRDFAPDLVITLGPPQHPTLGVILEVQRATSARKRTQLARYAAQLWLMLDRPVASLMICPHQRVADYFSEPVQTELPGYTFAPMILGPNLIPTITDPDEAAANLEIATLGIMAHGHDPEVGEAFLRAAGSQKKSDAARYYDYASAFTPPSVHRLMEMIMTTKNLPIHSKLLRGFKAQGHAESLLKVLAARDITVSPTDRERILATTDEGILDKWLMQASTANTIEDVLA